MQVATQVMNVILQIYAILTAYTVVFIVVGFLVPSKKFKKTDKRYNFAILVAARNEENAIGQLLDSIKKQRYPEEKITVFVIAHNCTDRTAEIAREAGVNVFEYNNSKERRKGYALRHAVKRIIDECEQGIYSFDGYFIIDADTVIEADYISKMNDAFDNKKYDMYTSYLNTKNNDKGILAPYSGANYYNANCTNYRPRNFFGISPIMPGSGVLIRNIILRHGWKWTTIVEDHEMSVASIAKGYRSTTVQQAQFYVENPSNLRFLIAQQMRWRRGAIVAFFKIIFPALFGILLPYDFSKGKKKEERPKVNVFEKGLIGLQKRFSCYDVVVQILPIYVLSFILGVIYPIVSLIIALVTNDVNMGVIFNQVLNYYIVAYGSLLLTYALTTIREHKNIHANKMYFIYIFIWPIINILMSYVAFIAVFIPVKWTPIPRKDERQIDEIESITPIKDLIFKPKHKSPTPSAESAAEAIETIKESSAIEAASE